MTLAEALSQGLQVTVVGLTIVFSVLIILMLVMMLMKVVFYNPTQPKKEKVKKAPAPKAKKSTGTSDDELMAVITAAVASAMDESELIAVLTAAVAASRNTSTYNLKIKSYRRVENAAPAWNKAGLRDVIDSRF